MDAVLARPRDLWFLNTRVTIRVSYTDGADGISVLEHWAPHGDSPPLHVHEHEDEIFHILEGAFRFLPLLSALGIGTCARGPARRSLVPRAFRTPTESSLREAGAG